MTPSAIFQRGRAFVLRPKMLSLMTGILLLVAYALLATLKFQAFWQAPGFEKNHRTLFWTESAMHEYMTQKVAAGESLYELDPRAQAPEGIELARDIAPGMPWLVGTAYRWLSPAMPFDIFIVYAFLFYSCLTVFGVYLSAREVFDAREAGLVAAFLYAVATPALARSVGGFIKEDLALPALTFGFYFLFTGLRRESYPRTVAAALCVSLALISWHFSQFMWLVFAVAFTLSQRTLTRKQLRLFGLLTLSLALRSMSFPMLRATYFAASPAMALLYGVVIFHIARRYRQNAVPWIAGLLVFAGTVAIYFTNGLREQSHVFGLVIDKLRFFLMKPVDPTRLSYETRSNWIEDFNSPDLYFILTLTTLYLPVGLFALVRLGRAALNLDRDDHDRIHDGHVREPLARFLAIYGLAFAVFFVLARRMITIDIIFLCIAIGGLVIGADRRRRLAGWLIALTTMAAGASASSNFGRPNDYTQFIEQTFPRPQSPEIFTVAEHLDILYWLKRNTQVDDTILASMGFSPVILAYAQRPIVIHSMFDAVEMRLKRQESIEKLYASEEAFYDFAVRNTVKYFVYESKNLLLDGPDSERYVAGNLNPDEESAVYRFHFRPQKLRHFRLLYQNAAYRVFRVEDLGQTDGPGDLTSPEFFPQPIYDETTRSIPDSVRNQLRQAREEMLSGFRSGRQIQDAIRIWEHVRQTVPATLEIHAQLCLAYLIAKNYPAAKETCALERRHYPHAPLGHYHTALLLRETGRPEEALAEAQIALDIDPRMDKARRLRDQLRAAL